MKKCDVIYISIASLNIHPEKKKSRHSVDVHFYTHLEWTLCLPQFQIWILESSLIEEIVLSCCNIVNRVLRWQWHPTDLLCFTFLKYYVCRCLSTNFSEHFSIVIPFVFLFACFWSQSQTFVKFALIPLLATPKAMRH